MTWHGSLHVGCRTMPNEFDDDHGRVDQISSGLWHRLAGHDAARWTRLRLQDKARAGGFDVHKVETSIATPKTSWVNGVTRDSPHSPRYISCALRV